MLQEAAGERAPRPAQQGCDRSPAIYRPRNPCATTLYRLIEKHYDSVKGLWEERFEHRYGFWRGFVDSAINRYLDCGLFEHGFARVQCARCQHEFLVAFSCQGRGLCPSCGAKRAAAFAAFLSDEVLEDVAHDQWVFSLPKMIRPYFIYHRELLGALARASYETVSELMAALLPEDEGCRPGRVTVVQTFGSRLNVNPHVHSLASRGGWTASGRFIPIASIDTHAAELLFRHKVLKLLKKEGLLSDERIDVMLSWQHSGFSVHNAVGVDRQDRSGLERLSRYLLRSPVSLARLRWDEETDEVAYALKGSAGAHPHDVGEPDTIAEEKLDAMEFVARVITHIPEPRLHVVHYFGAYSSVVRARRRQQDPQDSDSELWLASDEKPPPAPSASRRAWADLIRRIYQVDPLVCARCGGEMRIISFITDPSVIRKILVHLARRAPPKRGPPHSVPSAVRSS